MRNDLNCVSQVVSCTFFSNNLPINLPSSNILCFLHIKTKYPSIMTKINIDFPAIISDIHFTMLDGIHRSSIYVKIGVNFYQINCSFSHLQIFSDARGYYSFTNPRHHTSYNEDELCFFSHFSESFGSLLIKAPLTRSCYK